MSFLPEWLDHFGVRLYAEYSHKLGVLCADVRVHVTDVARLHSLPKTATNGAMFDNIVVMDGQGAVAYRSHTSMGIATLHERHRQYLAKQSCPPPEPTPPVAQAMSACYQQWYDNLEIAGCSTATLRQLLSKIKLAYEAYNDADETPVDQAVEAFQCEIHRLLVEGLTNGSVAHPDAYSNCELLRELVSWRIRSGDAYPPSNREILQKHYTAVLAGEYDIRRLALYDLRLPRETYHDDIEVVMKQKGIELAPASISLPVAGRVMDFAITYYQRVDRNGALVPVGKLTLPKSVFQDPKARGALRELPYGIKLDVS